MIVRDDIVWVSPGRREENGFVARVVTDRQPDHTYYSLERIGAESDGRKFPAYREEIERVDMAEVRSNLVHIMEALNGG